MTCILSTYVTTKTTERVLIGTLKKFNSCKGRAEQRRGPESQSLTCDCFLGFPPVKTKNKSWVFENPINQITSRCEKILWNHSFPHILVLQVCGGESPVLIWNKIKKYYAINWSGWQVKNKTKQSASNWKKILQWCISGIKLLVSTFSYTVQCTENVGSTPPAFIKLY